jgi:hypothetical protein
MFVEMSPYAGRAPAGRNVGCSLSSNLNSSTLHPDGVRIALDAFSINIQLLRSCACKTKQSARPFICEPADTAGKSDGHPLTGADLTGV